ncbi:hypothetical protein LCGC14_1336010 [marine sediment metagenome]|uniref:Uncharacterized protein n=1 Tax=marine sediment metagenome TaxID=412755 RepID=A0A0F9MW31_9ZZZZ
MMLEKILSVQDMLGIAMIVFIIVKYIQRKEKW